MTPLTTLRLAGATLFLCTSLATAAAETSAKEEANATRDCIKNASDFKRDGKSGLFVVELTNTCETRLRCTVNAYVVTSFGAKAGKAVLTLAPKSHGADATRSYTMKIKEAGGSANVSHGCKTI